MLVLVLVLFFLWLLATLGARLAHLGGYVGPSWGYVDPSWGYLDPAWRLCWPILGPCWPNLGTFFGLCCAMLTHLEPQSRKNARSRKHCKTRDCAGVGGRGGTPLSPSERRDAYGKDTARPLAGFKGLRPTAGQGPKQRGGGCCCWHILGAMLAHSRGCVGHSWAIFGLCGPS